MSTTASPAPRTSAPPARVPGWAQHALWALAYAAATWCGRLLRVEGSPLSLVWPAAAVGFGWVAWGWGRRRTLAVDVVLLTLVTTTMTRLTGASSALALVLGVANAVLVLVSVGVSHRLMSDGWGLRRPADLWALVTGALAGAVVSGLVGPPVIARSTGTPLATTELTWVLRDAVSTIVLVAAALRLGPATLAGPGAPTTTSTRTTGAGTTGARTTGAGTAGAGAAGRGSGRSAGPPLLGHHGEHLLVWAALAAGYGTVFWHLTGLPLTYTLVPLCVWVGLRLSTTAGVAHVLVVGAAVITCTWLGHGPFVTTSLALRLPLAQSFVGVVAVLTLLLALHRDERAVLLAGLDAARTAAEDQAELFGLAFETAPVGMMMIGVSPDDDRRILRANRALAQFTGRSLEELVTLGALDLVHPDEREAHAAQTDELLGGAVDTISVERRYATPAGQVRWGAVSASRVHPRQGAAYVIALIEDVTARREAEAALRHLATHDSLTGLPNRRLLFEDLEQALVGLHPTEQGRSGADVGLLYLDLDGFKAVNDGLGHITGDELLRHVAERLQGCVRVGDTVARLGGDEFAIVCPDVPGIADVALVADRVLAALSEPVALGGGVVTVGASIGVTSARGRCDPNALLAEADVAMYEAKRSGRGRVVVIAGTGSGSGATDAVPGSAEVGARLDA